MANHNAKAVEAIDGDGNVIGNYKTITEAAKTHHYSISIVAQRCSGRKGKRHSPLTFRYAKDVNNG